MLVKDAGEYYITHLTIYSIERSYIHSAAYVNDFENTSFFETFSFLNSICNYLHFLTDVKRYPGIRTRAHRIICIKRIPSLKKVHIFNHSPIQWTKWLKKLCLFKIIKFIYSIIISSLYHIVERIYFYTYIHIYT